MTEQRYARVVVFKEGDTLVAQCLEYDICAHAPDEETLRQRFEALFNFERNLSIERAGGPFVGLDQAPEEFHQMWRDNSERAEDMMVSDAHISLAKCA